MNICRQFAANLFHHRKRAGLSQEELGLESFIHPTWISHLESGRNNPSIITLAKLAGAMEIQPAALLTPVEPGDGTDGDLP